MMGGGMKWLKIISNGRVFGIFDLSLGIPLHLLLLNARYKEKMRGEKVNADV
jgi:hypothetical protein